jgi:hypothetical protein
MLGGIPRLAFCLCAIEARAFQIVGPKLHVGAKLLFHFLGKL